MNTKTKLVIVDARDFDEALLDDVKCECCGVNMVFDRIFALQNSETQGFVCLACAGKISPPIVEVFVGQPEPEMIAHSLALRALRDAKENESDEDLIYRLEFALQEVEKLLRRED